MEQYFARRIVDVLHDIASRRCRPQGDRDWTNTITRELDALGRELGFVWASPGEGGWLFDACWLDYEDFESRLIRKLVLAVESEWLLPIRDLRIDFNKLLVSNAQLAVMIFQDAPRSDFDARIEQFKESIGACSTRRTAPILFAGYINESGLFRFLYFENGRETPLTPAIKVT